MQTLKVNCLTESEMIKGKNGRATFKNEWRKVDDAEDCNWREMTKFC